MSTAPLLSIGIIFKNEERCIERCLKSLQPLRDSIPCEVVMADTGATDGSRAIAESYADEVFDFAWCDDFSAARNAVMDRCHGKWYMSIDCDEWLHEDISELLRFLKGRKQPLFGFVTLRNYSSAELERGDAYSEFFALRIVRMDTGCRYHGIIHEAWPYSEPSIRLAHTVLHHDGYLYTDPKAYTEKTRRNMELLRKKLEGDPKNLFTVLQCMESGGNEPDYLDFIRRGVEMVQNRQDRWELFGAIILRHAADTACKRKLPEFEEWVALGEEMFPQSIYTRVDLNTTAFWAAHDAKEWEKAVRYGEGYRKGLLALRSIHQSKEVRADLSRSTLWRGDPASERKLLIALANACFNAEQYEKALYIIKDLDGRKLAPDQVRNAVVILCRLHAWSQLDVFPVLTSFYRQISQNEPDEQRQKARLAAFNAIAAAAFTKDYRRQEQQDAGCWRPSYTALRCLADKCEAGRAAELMMTIGPDEMRAVLARVEDWQALPIEALEYALLEGAIFPPEESPLTSEVMSGLAARLTQGENLACQLALALPLPKACEQGQPNMQELYWAQSLALAALETFDWAAAKDAGTDTGSASFGKETDSNPKAKDGPKTGLALIRRFAQLEAALLPILYAPQMLTEQNAALLPPMHRWGLYCTKALDALDGGSPQAYIALLRRGVQACPDAKEMVQFMLDRLLEKPRPAADPELLALAEKIRAILAAYDPNSPAVAALKESPAYKQVAWIIEGESGDALPAQPAPQGYRPAKTPVRAVFFAELGEKWDAMQSVYEFMREDPRFDPVVVRTPVFRIVQQDGKQKQETIYRDFLTPMGIPSLGYDEYDLAADRPDLAFISQPYESCTLPQFWPENIAKHTRLVYLPYFLPERVHHNTVTALTQMPVYAAAWKAVCSGKKHYAFYCRHAANGGANALITGLPKTDPLVALAENPSPLPDGWEMLSGKTVFLWNSWYDFSASSLRYFETIFAWFAAHRDCALIWRPHPMSTTVTKLYYPEKHPAYREMLRKANAAENVLVDQETSCFAAFSVSRAMISDFSSLLPQYLLLDKPALWIKGDGFRFTGEEFIDSRWMEQAGRAEDVLAFLERIRAGEDRGAELRVAVRKRDLPLADGRCGQRVCEAVWQALQEENLP